MAAARVTEDQIPAEQAQTTQDLTNDKAQRIVAAMRLCVAKYGAAGATFDHVAREAGVSRGLLHYYFGSKEKLLIEVVRSETARLVELIKAASTAATSAQELVDIFLAQLENIIQHEPELYLLGFELIGEARRHPEIGNEVAEYNRKTRAQFGEILDELQKKDAIQLRHSPLATASALLAMANGLAMEMFQDPDGDHDECVTADLDAALYLLGAQ
jgi:AcrR family transcriptional regulator